MFATFFSVLWLIKIYKIFRTFDILVPTRKKETGVCVRMDKIKISKELQAEVSAYFEKTYKFIQQKMKEIYGP